MHKPLNLMCHVAVKNMQNMRPKYTQKQFWHQNSHKNGFDNKKNCFDTTKTVLTPRQTQKRSWPKINILTPKQTLKRFWQQKNRFDTTKTILTPKQTQKRSWPKNYILTPKTDAKTNLTPKQSQKQFWHLTANRNHFDTWSSKNLIFWHEKRHGPELIRLHVASRIRWFRSARA